MGSYFLNNDASPLSIHKDLLSFYDGSSGVLAVNAFFIFFLLSVNRRRVGIILIFYTGEH